MPTPAPHARMVKVRELATGQIHEVWPVDARERVNHPLGGWTYAADDAVTAEPAPAPEPKPSIREVLAAKSMEQLQTIARNAGVATKRLDREALITAILPHAEAGTVAITLPTMFPAPPPATLFGT